MNSSIGHMSCMILTVWGCKGNLCNLEMRGSMELVRDSVGSIVSLS